MLIPVDCRDQRGRLSGWGGTYLPGVEERSEDLRTASEGHSLSRGLGRSYGDSSLPAKMDQLALGTTLADRILGFDEATGVITVESGLCLAELNRIFIGRNWFTPVTPGTKYVTIGGMVASDVHGKNHHISGTFGKHVRSLLIRTGQGSVVRCSREEHMDLFFATLGGMGLTGHILEVSFQMEKIPSPWIYTESYRVSGLDELLALSKEKGKTWPLTVAWVDTLSRGKSMGRGILFVGRWATTKEAPKKKQKLPRRFKIPITLPFCLINRFTVGLFNTLLYFSHFPKKKSAFVDPNKYFYPLDNIHHWNRLYGKKGVTQHQSVIPNEAGVFGIRQMIEELAASRTASFLTIIKVFGVEGEGLLSFPMPGISLNLDLPIDKDIPNVIHRLNKLVSDYGGRIYLTKDGLSKPEDFQRIEPRLSNFLDIRDNWDPDGNIRSAQSQRLMGK